VFKGALDEYDWLKPDVRAGLGPVSQDTQPGRHLPYVRSEERRAWEAHEDRIRRESAALEDALRVRTDALAGTRLEERLAELPEVLRADLRAMLAAPPAQRSAVQLYLAEKFEATLRFDRERLMALDPDFRQAVEATQAAIAALAAQRLPEPRVHALWDRGQPSPTYMYRRGDPLSPGRLVGPG
jgi:hypothetical protein